jgi:3-methyladenine DNA glycosylase Tag
LKNQGSNFIPEIVPESKRMKKKINAVVKKAQMLRILVQIMGFFHFIWNKERWLEIS